MITQLRDWFRAFAHDMTPALHIRKRGKPPATFSVTIDNVSVRDVETGEEILNNDDDTPWTHRPAC